MGGAHSFGFIGVVKGVNGTRKQKLSLEMPRIPVGAGLLAKAVYQKHNC
jgi:hypothetical protein